MLQTAELDIFSKREPAVKEEIQSLQWLGKEYKVIESDVLNSINDIVNPLRKRRIFLARNPSLSTFRFGQTLYSRSNSITIFQLPVLLLGNNRPDTSSLVGMLGAGGALDQVGCQHFRVFEHSSEKSVRNDPFFYSGMRHDPVA